MPLGGARREIQRVEIALQAPLDAGPQDFDGNDTPLICFNHLGLVHLRDRGRAYGRAERRKGFAQRHAERSFDRSLGFGLRKRRHLVLQRLKVARERDADHIGARGEKLPKLDVSRPEPRQRGGEPQRRTIAGRMLQQACEPQAQPRGRRQRGRINQTQHAFAREHEAGPCQTEEMRRRRNHKRQPECNATMPPLITR